MAGRKANAVFSEVISDIVINRINNHNINYKLGKYIEMERQFNLQVLA